MSNRVQTIVAVILLIGIGIGAAYYWLRTPPQPEPMRLEQVVTLGKFTSVDPPRPAPVLQFTSLDGKTTQRAADFKGRWLMINLWATWCAPCLNEMPSLNRLNERMGDRLAMVAVSEDRAGKEAVDPFVTALHLEKLPIGLDAPGSVASALAVQGLPTSFLIDPKGRVVARLEGAAEWDSPITLKALDDLMAKTD